MPNNKILFIVEGASDEVTFVKRLLTVCDNGQKYDIYPYRCNIHTLAQILYNEYPDFDDDEVNIQLVLKSHESDQNKKELLSQKFRDIFLIFDFEPQHDLPHFDTVRRMLLYFSDSANHGKLYINYPMMQSYKHFSMLPDDTFADKTVTIDECHHYKEIVGKISNYTDLNAYSYQTFISLLVHHIKKANRILTGKYCLPVVDEYLEWDAVSVYDIQCARLQSGNPIYVLNTCIMILSDFAPVRFFRSVSSHRDEFCI